MKEPILTVFLTDKCTDLGFARIDILQIRTGQTRSWKEKDEKDRTVTVTSYEQEYVCVGDGKDVFSYYGQDLWEDLLCNYSPSQSEEAAQKLKKEMGEEEELRVAKNKEKCLLFPEAEAERQRTLESWFKNLCKFIKAGYSKTGKLSDGKIVLTWDLKSVD